MFAAARSQLGAVVIVWSFRCVDVAEIRQQDRLQSDPISGKMTGRHVLPGPGRRLSLAGHRADS